MEIGNHLEHHRANPPGDAFSVPEAGNYIAEKAGLAVQAGFSGSEIAVSSV